MKEINGEIYLEISEIEGGCDLPAASIRVLLSRGMANWQYIKDPEDRRRSLIRYSTLSTKYQNTLKAKYWSGAEPIQAIQYMKPEADTSAIVEAVIEAYENYHFYQQYYQHVTAADDRKTQKARKYLARAASCMSAIHIYYSQNNISPSNRKPIIEVSEYLMDEKEHLFPKPYGYMKCSVRHIQESLKALQDGASIDEVITQPRVGNENRLGESHAYIKGAVARMLTTGKNPTVADVVRKVQYLCSREQLGSPSESTIYKYVGELKSITNLQRFGDANKASQNSRFSIPTARAMYAGDCWEMDGTRVQIQPFVTSSGASVTSSGVEKSSGTQLQYLYIVAVRDVYSGAYLGWSFGVAESGLMYREALKMATTLAGYLPYELRHDRFPGHNSDEMERLFEAIANRGVKLTKTSTATGKAAVERAFGTLQSVFEADRREWVGQGIRSSRDHARPTAEYLAKTHKQLKSEGFTWEEAWRVENEVMMTYNYTPMSLYSKKYRNITQSPLELHDQDSDKPNTIKIENYDIADLFWATRKITIRNYAVTVEVNRNQHTYMLTDERYYNIILNHQAVLVKFDAADMSSVMLFDALYATFLDTATEFDKPNLYGPNADFATMATEKAKQKALKQKLNAELAQVQAACTDDILGIQIGHLMPKANAELAETSAMANYWRNTVPVAVNATPKQKQKKASPESPQRHIKADALSDILNQM
jgi:hypothetical protein